MAIFAKGADPEALEAAAVRLARYARECDGIRSEAGAAVHGLTGQWRGGDVQRLLDRWPSTSSRLEQCGTTLDGLVDALRRNARAQTVASSGGPGGGGATHGPTGRGPGGGSDGGQGGVGGNPDNPTGDDDLGDYTPLDGPVPLDDAEFAMDRIRQGQIGDCWLLAALGSVGSNDPQWIRDHLRYDAEAGTYTVTLYDDGKPVEVTVDASTIAQGEKDSADGDANWVSVYEKAVASYRGGKYDDIDGGWPDDAMRLITGRDTEKHDDMSLDDIRDGLANGHVYSAATENHDTWWPFDDEVDDNRVVPNHAYMVDRVEEHDGQQMIHLVNPWGPDGGHMSGDENFKWGDLWLTQEQYHESFADTSGVQGRKP